MTAPDLDEIERLASGDTVGLDDGDVTLLCEGVLALVAAARELAQLKAELERPAEAARLYELAKAAAQPCPHGTPRGAYCFGRQHQLPCARCDEAAELERAVRLDPDQLLALIAGAREAKRLGERNAQLEANLLDYWARYGAVAHIEEPAAVRALNARIAELERERDEALHGAERDASLTELAAQSQAAYERGQAAERAAVVAWLRWGPSVVDANGVSHWVIKLGEVAKLLERGEHIDGAGEGG